MAHRCTSQQGYLITAHCSGDRVYELARQALGNKVIHSAVGTRFEFGKAQSA